MQRTNILACLLLSCCLGCTSKPFQSQGVQIEAYTPDANAVPFDIEPAQDSNCPSGNRCFLAKYQQQQTIAQFRIEFAPSPRKSKDEFITAFGHGRIVSVEGSDSSLLLQSLKRALEAKNLPKKVQRKPYIGFEYAELGNRLSHAPNGGMNVNPPGNWSATKLFLGGDEGEVFLNLNPVLRKGEFSIKDPDYGDFVLAELAKVL